MDVVEVSRDMHKGDWFWTYSSATRDLQCFDVVKKVRGQQVVLAKPRFGEGEALEFSYVVVL